MAADLQAEFEAETQQLLRRRFLWFSGVVGFLSMLGVIVVAVAWAVSAGGRELTLGADPEATFFQPRFATVAVGVVATMAYVVSFLLAWRGNLLRVSMLGLSQALVIFDGLVNVGLYWWVPEISLGILGVLVTHLLASLFLPWEPRQALQPLIPVLFVHIVLLLIMSDLAPVAKLMAIAASPLVGAPGTFVCWLRHSRRLEKYQLRFLQRRYGEVRRELTDARRIHEALFPRPILDGPVRVRYVYEPMRQIGGDFFYATRPDAIGRVSIVVLDVTGHGIAAALTVNRIFGELERLFAEQPDLPPGQVLRDLNRYANLTLSPHSIYLTAFCARANPTANTLEWASGGHPPAFLLGVDQSVTELASTALVLGATSDRDFESGEQSTRFGPGDVLIAYTDGALEARVAGGPMLGLSGLRRLLSGGAPDASAGWPATILSAVERYRKGPPEDDTLLVEILRPLPETPPLPPPPPPKTRAMSGFFKPERARTPGSP